MCCTFSCAHEQAGRNLLVFILLQICLCYSVIRSHLCVCVQRRNSVILWVKVYSAFDLHICYNDIRHQITIFPLKHSRLNSLYKKPLQSLVTMTVLKTLHTGAASPALFLIYWATLYTWVTVSLWRLLAIIVHYSYYCYQCF